ncbi:Protein RCC2 [Dirofilaria immitis]
MCMADQKSESRGSFESCEKELAIKESFEVHNPWLFLNGDNNSIKHQTFPLCNFSRAVKTAIGRPLEQALCDEVGMTEIKNINVWDGLGEDSTFVSIENLPNVYCKQNANMEDLSQNCIVHNERSSMSDGRTSLADSQNDDFSMLPEIWTWEANENGQLGHGDLTVRRDPFKIVDLSNMYCIKVAAGDDHTIAVTRSWQVICVGIKQEWTVKTSKPIVGSHSFVLDAFASGCQTGVIVGSVANSPTVYLCGSNIMEKSPQLLSLPKEIG